MTFKILPLLLATCLLICLAAVGLRSDFRISDLSWPNCTDLPTKTSYRMVIVGVNGGLDFKPNPCLASESEYSTARQFYLNSGDPGFPRIKMLSHGPLSCKGDNLICYSFNYGFAAAKYDQSIVTRSWLSSDFWWIDVETDNSWTNNPKANQANILGMIAALKNAHQAIGIYTTSGQWQQLMGNWRPGLPLWLGTGDSNLKAAAALCHSPSVTGGPLVMAQYTLGNLDYNVPCLALTDQFGKVNF